MNDIQVFRFEAKDVRTYMIDGEPWWVLRDVADALAIERGARVAERLEADEVRQAYITDSIGRKQETTIINESGLYSVILRSDKPEARRFRKWVTSEVLPAIRKTGSYSIPRTLPEALRLAADIEEQRKALEEKVHLLAPAAAVADRIANAEGLKTISEIGKINGIGPRRMFPILSDLGIIYRSRGTWVPYQQWIDAGYFEVKEVTYQDGEEIDHLKTQTYVTGKGEVWLAKQFFPAVAV